MPKTYIDLRAAVERSGRSRTALYRLIHDGVLPARRNGQKYEVTVADLEFFTATGPADSKRDEHAELKTAAKHRVAEAPPMSPGKEQEVIGILWQALPILSGAGARG